MTDRDSRSQLIEKVALGLGIAVGLIVSSALLSNALLKAKQLNEALEVKGYAERAITSDFATWRGQFTVRNAELRVAYAELEAAREQTRDFLRSHHVADTAFEFEPVALRTLYVRTEQGAFTNEVEGYDLSQEVVVSSEDIQLIASLSRESDALVKLGVEFSSQRPEYIYTRLGELKLEMLAAATADARERAETLATNSGGRIGPLLSARQGVFQITAAHSTEISDYGRNDTSSREKSIKAVVTVRFSTSR